jgi:hypothetical protein
VLFDPASHEPLVETPWDADAARAAVAAIADDAEAALRPGEWWPWHPLDRQPGDPDVVHGIYLGAAGVLLALRHVGRDHPSLAREALDSYRRRPEFGGPLPSLWLGEGGIALVAWLLAPSRALGDRLAAHVRFEERVAFEILERRLSTPELMRLGQTVADAPPGD